jgi:hypothetical protein
MIPPLYFDPTEPTVFYRKLEVGEIIMDGDRGIIRPDVPEGGGSVDLTHRTICGGCTVKSSDGNLYFRRITPEPPKPESPSPLNELFDLWFIKYSPVCVDEDERRVWERAIKAMNPTEK